MNADTLEIVYTWPDTGREEVRYRREPADSPDARKLMQEVEEMQARAEFMGYECPYSIRFI